MLNGLNTVVVGAGIGGLTVALTLARHGAKVRIIEQAAALTEVGAGLQISPNGFAVLKALKLDDALDQHSVTANAVQLLNHRGEPVTRLDLDRYGTDAYHFVHRADLVAILQDAAVESGVTLTLGAQVSALTADPKPRVTTEDGQTFDADLVIAADGINSMARDLLNTPSEAAFTGQVAWRALVPETELSPEVRVFMGPKRHLVTYPLRGGSLRNIVAVQERAQWAKSSWSQSDEPGNLRKVFADFGPEVTGLLSRVDEVYLWGLFRHPVAERWHNGHVALLGDAAHPTLPFLAQGANMAIEDAWVLAACLETAQSVSKGLQAYQAARLKRTSRIVNAAQGNAWKYHLANPALRFGAHTLLRLVGGIAPGRLVGQFDWLYGHDVTR